ncbi:hypothetical protein ENSA5_43130 [Enhygromyxa salina]|uniref:Uncharacterized protein n=1 Tax=Enhygromyxa salina TaxID=215803 RepID=A0A2S9XKT4_9BACT|nr:hypothetical protein ENSA5_43130 [Enhygromyxa salina]
MNACATVSLDWLANLPSLPLVAGIVEIPALDQRGERVDAEFGCVSY